MRIIHLSDLHINKYEIDKFEDYFIPALKKDLEAFHSQRNIDLIIVSGDMVDKGGISFGSLTKGFEYFKDNLVKEISDLINIPSDRFFFVPGNHDIDRKANEEFEDKGLFDCLKSEEDIDSFIAKNNAKGIERILEFKEFEKTFYQKSSIQKDLTNFQSSFKIEIEDMNIGVACFNTAWRCYDSPKDKERILLGEKQITKANKFLNECDIKIAIAHHPFDWLRDFDCKYCEPAIRNEYDILLCGHVHEASNWSKTDIYGNLFISNAPSNWTANLRSDSRESSNGYSIIDYDNVNDKIICHNRRYNHIKRTFDPNTDVGDERGISEYILPTAKEKTLLKIRGNICENIMKMHREEINDHLLSASIKIDAPKDINELYVNPTIRKHEDVKIQNQKKDEMRIDEIYNSDESSIIFGHKESGKTLLLDKLIIEFTKNVAKLNKIPVYFDYRELKNKRIEQIISNYLGIGIMDVKQLITQHKIVLLVDNLEYVNNRKLCNLVEFIKKNGIQVIATSLTTLQGNVDPKLFDQALFSQYKIVFLELFNSKQIKQLVTKWFVNDREYDHPNKVKSVVNTLLALNLPRTPLAISMFLWIIEQQENIRPKNYAAMLQNFIEKLLEKASIVDIYSQDFDYTNKLLLLTDIAYEMYTRNEENYSIPLIDLTKFIQDNLILKKFEFDYQEVLEDFIYRGIISVETKNNIKYARFRYNCFFSYMLMNKMDTDPEFFEFVMKEENYLNFVNEIDYFTALKRTRSDILVKVFTRLQDIFNAKIEAIEQLEFGFDSLHKEGENDLLVDSIEDDFIEIIESKPGDEEVDTILDNLNDSAFEETSSATEEIIKRKPNEISDFERMDSIIYLSAKMLKNTEEIKIKDLKYKSYMDFIRCSMCYNKLFLEYIEQQHEANNHEKQTIEIIEVQKKFAPALNQMVLYLIMGTNKLRTVIKEKIDNDFKDDQVSDYERFISIFLYSDMEGEESLSYINRFIKTLKHSYMKDMILFKLIYYYIFQSKTKEADRQYTDAIAELIKRSSKTERRKRDEMKTFDKHTTVENLKKLKKDTLKLYD